MTFYICRYDFLFIFKSTDCRNGFQANTILQYSANGRETSTVFSLRSTFCYLSVLSNIFF